jgi:hypothetical protein
MNNRSAAYSSVAGALLLVDKPPVKIVDGFPRAHAVSWSTTVIQPCQHTVRGAVCVCCKIVDGFHVLTG